MNVFIMICLGWKLECKEGYIFFLELGDVKRKIFIFVEFYVGRVEVGNGGVFRAGWDLFKVYYEVGIILNILYVFI